MFRAVEIALAESVSRGMFRSRRTSWMMYSPEMLVFKVIGVRDEKVPFRY
jgi:hypothetical protein